MASSVETVGKRPFVREHERHLRQASASLQLALAHLLETKLLSASGKSY